MFMLLFDINLYCKLNNKLLEKRVILLNNYDLILEGDKNIINAAI